MTGSFYDPVHQNDGQRESLTQPEPYIYGI